MQRSDRMEPVVIFVVQNFDSFKSVPYHYPILGPEHAPSTLGELVSAGYDVWDTQATRSDSHDHSTSHGQSSTEIPAVSQHRERKHVQRMN